MITEKVAGADSTFEQDANSEKPIRSIVKAISWRVVGTIDTLVWKILNEKKKVIGTIMGENDIITEFLNEIDNGS